jgi:hypothetical protein
MDSIADNWWNEDRRDLFRSTEVVASDAQDANRLGASLDTILNDLELYDDPRQGARAWLFENELQLADQLGEELYSIVGDAEPVAAGAKALASSDWPNVRATAVALLSLMAANGDFTR